MLDALLRALSALDFRAVAKSLRDDRLRNGEPDRAKAAGENRELRKIEDQNYPLW